MRRACLVLLSLLAGCQDGVSVEASESTFCEEYAEVVCHNMYECCTEGAIEAELGVSEPRTEVQCREDKKRICERNTASLRASLAEGRVRFNADLYNTCLSSVLRPDDVCATYLTELPWEEACEEYWWEGTVATGGNCFFDHDCAGYPKTAECAPDQKCISLPTGGFPCAMGACAADFFCGPGLICQAKLAEGAPCMADNQCLEDLFCDTAAMPAVCTAKQPGGVACTGDEACESGICVPGKCMGTNIECFTDAMCGGHCADDNSACTVGSDYLCNTAGFCNTTTTVTCSGFSANQQCVNAGAGTQCVFAVSCVAGDCVGDPVCTAPLFTTDYCAIGLALNP